VWRAFRDLADSEDFAGFTYVDVGANYPWEMSITASLYSMGWRGLLVEADPDLAAGLRLARPGDALPKLQLALSLGTWCSTGFLVLVWGLWILLKLLLPVLVGLKLLSTAFGLNRWTVCFRFLS